MPRPAALAVNRPDGISLSVRLRAPRAAAIAGILFSVLLIASFVLLRRSVPADPLEAGAWLRTRSRLVVVALNLLPFAGIAFLWFTGVLRDRLGDREDRFFATVFLGSGLLFLAMLFFSAAVAGGISSSPTRAHRTGCSARRPSPLPAPSPMRS